MNDEYYRDEPIYKIRPSNVKAKLKPMFKTENGYFSPYLLNKKPVPAGREGYCKYFYEKHLKQKQIAGIIGKSESYITRRMKFIEDKIERDMIDDGELSPKEIFAELEYRKYARTGKTETFADVFVYDYLTSLTQEMVLRYLFLFRGQQNLIHFIFKWLVLYDGQSIHAKDEMSKYGTQLYKKYAVKMKNWAKQLFITLELELDRLVKRYGIKDSRPNEKFIKTVLKAAASKGMTVAQYRDKILFPHGKQRIIARFEQYFKLQNKSKK